MTSERTVREADRQKRQDGDILESEKEIRSHDRIGRSSTNGTKDSFYDKPPKRMPCTQDYGLHIYMNSDVYSKSKAVPKLLQSSTASEAFHKNYTRATAQIGAKATIVSAIKPRPAVKTISKQPCEEETNAGQACDVGEINDLLEEFPVEVSVDRADLLKDDNSLNFIQNIDENNSRSSQVSDENAEVFIEKEDAKSNVVASTEHMARISQESYQEISHEKNNILIRKHIHGKKSFEPNNVDQVSTGFFQSLTNIVHSCMGKRTMPNEENVRPTGEQLDPAKMKSLIKLLETSLEGADMKLSLFMAACAHDPRNLQPFPEKVLDDNDLNRHMLYFLAEEIPSVSIILFLLKEKNSLDSCREELIPVVDWLIRAEDPRLEALKENEKKMLLAKFSVSADQQPSKIFRLKAKRCNESETFWQSVKGEHESIFTYHNCKIEQAHSLIHNGLHNHLTRKGVFGPGIYLTDNLASCLDTCVAGSTWGKSCIGTKVKLVFITEIISNHHVTSYAGHGAPFYGDKVTCSSSNDTKYYFIKKPKLVRLRYLMVYVLEPSILPKNPFSYAPFRKKILKLISVFRVSLLIATIFLGATASQRNSQANKWFLDTLQNCYQKFSVEFTKWPIWKYVETPYVAVPLADSIQYPPTNV